MNSKYRLYGIYGTNTKPLLEDNKASIYWEISGDSIPDGAVVTMWAQLRDVDYTVNVGNDTHPSYIDHKKKPGYETVECSVKVNKTMDWSFMNATHVKSYYGYQPGIENVATGSSAWKKSGKGLFDTRYKQRYPMRHENNGWEQTSAVGCFAHRNQYPQGEYIELKSGIGYPVQLGYAIYNPTYRLGTDLLDKWTNNSWSALQPVYQGESEVLEFYWYLLEGAT